MSLDLLATASALADAKYSLDMYDDSVEIRCVGGSLWFNRASLREACTKITNRIDSDSAITTAYPRQTVFQFLEYLETGTRPADILYLDILKLACDWGVYKFIEKFEPISIKGYNSADQRRYLNIAIETSLANKLNAHTMFWEFLTESHVVTGDSFINTIQLLGRAMKTVINNPAINTPEVQQMRQYLEDTTTFTECMRGSIDIAYEPAQVRDMIISAEKDMLKSQLPAEELDQTALNLLCNHTENWVRVWKNDAGRYYYSCRCTVSEAAAAVKNIQRDILKSRAPKSYLK